MTILSVALAVVSFLIIAVLIVMSMRKVPVTITAAQPHAEGPNRKRVMASLARIVPPTQRVRFEAEAYPDVAAFANAAIALCGAEGARFSAAHTTDGRVESHAVSVDKYTFRANVPAAVGAESAEALLKLINQALKATSSARRMALLFDQQSHWFAVLEPGYAARLQRVGVVVAPSVP